MPIMRQRKNNGRLSRESWPGQRTKGSVSSVVAAAFPFRREYHLAMQPPICRARASSSLSLSFGSLCACWIKAVAEVQRFSRARMHGTRSDTDLHRPNPLSTSISPLFITNYCDAHSRQLICGNNA